MYLPFNVIDLFVCNNDVTKSSMSFEIIHLNFKIFVEILAEVSRREKTTNFAGIWLKY
jgi:hypothetical protein